MSKNTYKEFNDFSVKSIKLYSENSNNCDVNISGHNIFHFPSSEKLFAEYTIANNNYGIKDWKFKYTVILDYKHPYRDEWAIERDQREIMINKDVPEIVILKEYKLCELSSRKISSIEYFVGIYCEWEYVASKDFIVQSDVEV